MSQTHEHHRSSPFRLTREVQGILLVLLGGAVLRISLTSIYLRYVKEGMKPWLIASGALLLVLGALLLVDHFRSGGAESHEDEDDHGHSHGSMWSAWLLLLPVLAIFLIAPPALGAYTASRQASSVAQPVDSVFDALPAGDPVPLALADYATRAVWDGGTTLVGRRVELTGFVTPAPEGGWYLTRLSMSCCAADSVTVKVKAFGVQEEPANTWLTVVGHWIPGGPTESDSAIAWLQVDSLARVPEPKNPYE